MTWDPSPDAAVAGYKVHCGGFSRTYTNIVDVGGVLTVSVPDLAEGNTYFFAATAYDGLGQESDFSDEISYSVPGATTQLESRATTDGQFVLTVTGSLGHTYDVEATEDFATWTVIGTVTPDGSNALEFSDPEAANFPCRFYRTRAKP